MEDFKGEVKMGERCYHLITNELTIEVGKSKELLELLTGGRHWPLLTLASCSCCTALKETDDEWNNPALMGQNATKAHKVGKCTV